MKKHPTNPVNHKALSINARFGLLTILFLGTLNLSINAQQQQASLPPLKAMRVNCVTTKITKNLGYLMSNQEIRSLLHTQIDTSSKRESIIFLEEFLQSAVEVPTLPEEIRSKANKLLITATLAKKIFSKTAFSKYLASPEIDLYFPVSDHKDIWTGNADILIGVGALNEDVEKIRVFSMSEGKIIKIRAEEIPSKPVLMVTPCEHSSHAYVFLENVDIPEEEPATAAHENGYLQTNYFKITDDQEPWWKGDPEIYVLVAQYSQTAHLETVKKHLPGVNDEGRWKDLRGCPTALSFYWNEEYNDITYYEVMEEDIGKMGTLSVSVFGVTASFRVRDGDDELGSVNVHRDEVGWCPQGTLNNCCSSWTKQVSTGKALMRMTKAQ